MWAPLHTAMSLKAAGKRQGESGVRGNRDSIVACHRPKGLPSEVQKELINLITLTVLRSDLGKLPPLNPEMSFPSLTRHRG